jgi:hypothetical protein
MQKRNWTASGLVLLAALVGCGGGGGASVPLADLPPKLADSLCKAYQNCYGDIFNLFLGGADCTTVTLQRIENGSFPLLQGKVDQGKMHYDGSKAQACLDSLSARTCAQMLDRDSPECLAALDGTVALGGACDLDEECKGEALCSSPNATCPGQCASLLVAGQACSQDSDCQAGLQCSTETKLCVQPASADQACEYGSPPCGPGLLCLGKDDTNKTPGTCRTTAEAFSGVENGSCAPTLGQLCQTGLACVADSVTLVPPAITWTCVKTGSYAANAACKPGFPDACASGNYCKTGTGVLALNGTCTTIPAAGETCGTGLSQCQPSAACVSGLCQNLAQNGVSCTGDTMCYSGKCGTSGGCEANLPCK